MKYEGRIVPLGDICEFQRGLTYSKNDEVDFSNNIVLRATNIDLETNLLNLSELKYIRSDIVIPKNKRVRKDSLMICTASGSKSHLGKVALIDNNYGYAFGGFMGLIIPKEEIILPRYLFYLMISPMYKDFIGELSDGMNINNLRLDVLGKFPVPLPPLPEQQRIVAILDQAFDAIARARAIAAQNRANARALFENYLQTVFTQRGEGWVERQLEDVCEIRSSLVDPRESQYLHLPHVGGANIETKTGKLMNLLTAQEEGLISGKFLFDESMILYSKIRPYLMKVARPNFKGLCSADIYPLSVKPDQLDRNYLFYLLLSQNFTNYANTGSARAGMPKVNREHLFAYRFYLPPIKEQKYISDKMDDLIAETQNLEPIYERKLTALDELKSSLLHQAFTGQL